MRALGGAIMEWRRLIAFLIIAVISLFAIEVRADDSPATLPGISRSGQTAARAYAPPPDQPGFHGTLPNVPAPPASFNVYDGGWIRFAYPPAVRERVQPLIGEADRFRAEMSERFGRPVLNRVSVYVARTPGEMSTLAPEGAPYPKYASGVAYSEIGLVLLTIAPLNPNSIHNLSEVFKHELAHVALHDALGGGDVPRWFNEGFAVHASGESSLTRLQTLWTATLARNLLPLAQLERNFPADSTTAEIAYAESADIVRFLLRSQDRERFAALVRRVRSGQKFDAATADSYGVDLENLEYEWREEVAKRYSFWPFFFSGSVLWMGALALFIVGWRKRRARSRQTLDRWAREEALAEARRASRPPAVQPGRVHIVFPAAQSGEFTAMRPRAPSSDGDVPRIEHEGEWYTLH